MEKVKEKTSFFWKFVGDKKFYLMVLSIAVPIMIQNGITNFVSLLDNIMIGRIGTEQMSGAAIVNQLIFVYNLCIFGGVSGAGIFTAQYFGQKDHEGVRQTLRYKLWMAVILTALTIVLFLTAGDSLISMYLRGEGTAQEIRDTLVYGKQYLWIMLLGLPAFMMVQVYASTLRECGETVLPMKAGIVAVLINSAKNPLFTVEERVELLKECCKGIPNVSVEGFDGLTVEFAKKKHASVMVRGLRAVTDFENEIQLAQTNHALMPGIETMFLATSIKWSYLSSTIVKEAAYYGSDISKFVTPNVEKAVNEKYALLRQEKNSGQ